MKEATFDIFHSMESMLHTTVNRNGHPRRSIPFASKSAAICPVGCQLSSQLSNRLSSQLHFTSSAENHPSSAAEENISPRYQFPGGEGNGTDIICHCSSATEQKPQSSPQKFRDTATFRQYRIKIHGTFSIQII